MKSGGIWIAKKKKKKGKTLQELKSKSILCVNKMWLNDYIKNHYSVLWIGSMVLPAKVVQLLWWVFHLQVFNQRCIMSLHVAYTTHTEPGQDVSLSLKLAGSFISDLSAQSHCHAFFKLSTLPPHTLKVTYQWHSVGKMVPWFKQNIHLHHIHKHPG